MGNNRWKSFRSVYRETDLWVATDAGENENSVENFTQERMRFYRQILDEFIVKHPEFRDSLKPVRIPEGVHTVISEMGKAAENAGTGPMSAVAGAFAEYICNDLIREFGLKETIIENGGDIFMKLASPATISVYAGSSPLSGKINLVIKPEETPLAVCTSSGSLGHSLSFGKADACMVACRSGALADAYATAFCNEVKSKDMVLVVTEKALKIPEILSVVIIMDDKVGLGGTLQIKI